MIESSYNYYTPQNENMLCMNGVTGAVFSLNEDEYNFMKKLMADGTLQKKYPDLTNKLTQTHFLTENMNKEITYLREKYNKANDSGVWHLILNPTQDCNFRCWYCYEKHPKGRMQPETMERVKRLVDNIFDKGEIKHFSLGWFGGEPLLYFKEVVYPDFYVY